MRSLAQNRREAENFIIPTTIEKTATAFSMEIENFRKARRLARTKQHRISGGNRTAIASGAVIAGESSAIWSMNVSQNAVNLF